MRAWGVVIGLVLQGCQFDRPADVKPIDAGEDGLPIECEAGTRVCSGSMYTECGENGRYVTYEVPNGGPTGEQATLVMREYVCPMGCHATEPRCADIVPSNGVAVGFDEGEASAGGTDLIVDDPTGPATIFDTTNDPVVTVVFTNGTNVAVPARIVAQPGGTDLRVVELRSMTIAAGSRLKITSTRPIAFVSHFDVYVAGTLDFSGRDNTITTLRPGCDLMQMTPAIGGGGNSTAGGAASTGAAGSAAQTGNPELSPIEKGCASWSGIGGGGLQVVSRRRIALAATGVIDVSGRRGNALASGPTFLLGGGGAGGAVLLEAPAVGLVPGAIVIGRGGGGAAGNQTSGMVAPGADGNHDLNAASVPGGVCPDCTGRGGAGGTESSMAGAGTGTTAAGGGAVGRALIRSRAAGTIPTGTMKIQSLGFRTLATR